MQASNDHKATVQALLKKERYTFADLTSIMSLLRSENGCSWDREQTHQSIRNCFIEEVYEAVEAIDTEDTALLREELGDVLFQVVFHAQIESEQERFCVEDVVHDICVKMIHRHPHVFSDQEVSGAEDALARWEAIKIEEKQRKTLSSRLRAIPVILPALMRAEKVASKAGMTKEKSREEQLLDIQNRVDALSNIQIEDRQKAVGELLLAITVWASSLDISAEQALTETVERVISDVELQKT